MTNVLKFVAVLITALWMGGLFWVGFVIAPYLFILAEKNSPLVPHSGVAADLVGPLLYSAYALSLILAVGLIVILVILRKRNQVPLGSKIFLSEIGLGMAFLTTVINYAWCSPKVAAIRRQLNEQFGGFHLTDPAEPLYHAFKTYHLISVGLFGLSFIGTVVCLLCLSQFRAVKPETKSE
jgi:hypothetical protein